MSWTPYPGWEPPTHVWPPALRDLKVALGDPNPDSPHKTDERVTNSLVSAIGYVQARRTTFNYSGDIESCWPPVPDHIWEGTVRLAERWNRRHDSPDGVVTMGDMGTSRVPSVDVDIERMLGIGRFAGPVTA